MKICIVCGMVIKASDTHNKPEPCPDCGSKKIKDAALCDTCGSYFPSEKGKCEYLCKTCRANTEAEFIGYLSRLSPAEAKHLDSCLGGRNIYNISKYIKDRGTMKIKTKLDR